MEWIGNVFEQFGRATGKRASTGKTLNSFMRLQSPFPDFAKSEARPFYCRCLAYRRRKNMEVWGEQAAPIRGFGRRGAGSSGRFASFAWLRGRWRPIKYVIAKGVENPQ